MKKRLLQIAITVSVGLAAVLFLFQWLNREPEHAGRTLSAWVADLQHANPKVRQEASAALIAMGPRAVPYLNRELTRGSTRMQRWTEKTAKHVPDFIKRPLRRFYSPTADVVRKHVALHALKILGTNATETVPALGTVLRGPDVGLSSAAGGALSSMGTNGIPPLIAALDDADYNIRAAACHSLGVLRAAASPAVPRLARMVTEETGAIARAAITTLTQIGPPAVPVLTSFLASTNPVVRYWGAFALANIRYDAGAPAPSLLAATGDESEGVRYHALQAVAGTGPGSPEVSRILLGALGDPSAEVRQAALAALLIRPRVVIENIGRVSELLDDPASSVRASAAAALGQSGHHGLMVVPRLQGLLSDTNENVTSSAAAALHSITNSVELVRRAE